jgi:hypothetical protein
MEQKKSKLILSKFHFIMSNFKINFYLENKWAMWDKIISHWTPIRENEKHNFGATISFLLV